MEKLRAAKSAILRRYGLSSPLDEFAELIQAGKESPHRPLTKKVLKQIWQRGRARAKSAN